MLTSSAKFEGACEEQSSHFQLLVLKLGSTAKNKKGLIVYLNYLVLKYENTYADSIRRNISCILMRSNMFPIPQDHCIVHNHRKSVSNRLNGTFDPRQAKENLCKLWKFFDWHLMVLQLSMRCSSLDQNFYGNLERNCVLVDIQWHKLLPGYLKSWFHVIFIKKWCEKYSFIFKLYSSTYLLQSWGFQKH